MIPTAKKEESLLVPILDRLAVYQPGGMPFVSLYLNLQPDPQGRDHFEPFVRKELKARARTYPPRSPERESLERDMARIAEYLSTSIRRSANGAAIFSCAADDLFEAVAFEAPIDQNQLYVQPHPQLYPLARVMDQYPRYGILITDTNAARLFVVGLHELRFRRQIENAHLPRTEVGGWAQARFQRHVDNLYMRHAKEVADALESLVRLEGLDKIVVSAEKTILPILRDQLPRHVADRLIEVQGMDKSTPEAEMLQATIDVIHQLDAMDDVMKVAHVLDEYRAGGLGVVGVEETTQALEKGQVDELLISGFAADVRPDPEGAALDPDAATRLANDLVVRARQTAASITFIEDGRLLSDVGGVAARLRYVERPGNSRPRPGNSRPEGA